MKILIVDDTKVSRYFAKKVLKELGYNNFLEAESVAEAKVLLGETSDIGLILSDWYMPNETGLDLLKYIRVHFSRKDIPFLIQTSDPSRANVLAAFKLGIQSYLMKPLTHEVLYEKLTAISEKADFPSPIFSEKDTTIHIAPLEKDPTLGFHITNESMVIDTKSADIEKLLPYIKEMTKENRYLLLSSEGVASDYKKQIHCWQESQKS